MVQLINDTIFPSWIPFISKNPQLMLTTTKCDEESNQNKNGKKDNIFTVQSVLNTLAFSDQLLLNQLKDNKAAILKNEIHKNFWDWTFQICWFIRHRYLNEFDLEALVNVNDNKDVNNANINYNNYYNPNIIQLSISELIALTRNSYDDHNCMNTDDDEQKEKDAALLILNLHKNLCYELSTTEKDSNYDNKKKVFFLWWFISYNLLKIFNSKLNIYDEEELRKILGSENSHEVCDFSKINFTDSTHSGYDYFNKDILSYGKHYLGSLGNGYDNNVLLFFNEKSNYENCQSLFNQLKTANNMNCIPVTFTSFTSKMEESTFYKEQKIYESIKASKNINEFTITKQLGKGSSGFVRDAIHNKTGTKVIIKYVVKSLILRGCWSDSSELAKKKIKIECSNSRRFPNEIAVLQYIHDELDGDVPNNLTSLITYWEDSIYYYLVFANTDFESDLFDYIDKNPNGLMPENEAKIIFKNILDAVQILHHHNIVHRDIKDENILINYKTKEIQLIDFGSSAFYDKNQKLTNFVGSFLFAAPEIIKGLSYEGPQQDIWSLGILLYTMIYKATPFNDYYDILRNKMRFPQEISKECKELILWMTNKDINKRPTIDQILNHPWFNN